MRTFCVVVFVGLKTGFAMGEKEINICEERERERGGDAKQNT
jgi:hypothetical protein